MRDWTYDLPDEPEYRVVTHCTACGKGIREMEEYYDMGSYILCESCFDDFVAQAKRTAEICE